MPFKDRPFIYEFDGKVPKKRVKALANMFGYTMHYKFKAEENQILITSNEVMPRELRDLITELSEFETLVPDLKEYLKNEGLAPFSHRIVSNPLERYEKHKEDISKIWRWGAEMRGYNQNTFDRAMRFVHSALVLDNYSNVENPVVG